MKGVDLGEALHGRAVRTIARNAEVQAQLVDDLLDVSRIISGKMRLQFGTSNLSGIVTAAVDSVRPAAAAKGVELRVSSSPTAAKIWADADRLQQVVWNLLSNAIKFSSPGGTVEVRAQHSDDVMVLTVADTGVGIPAEVLPFVFERFRQADSSTTRGYGGVGLGLAIVQHLVELHGGSVHAASAGSGQGATFTVRLPGAVPPQHAEPASPTEPTPVATRAPRIANEL
jgi:signal transduction histidine kinase